jgi:hypothetical protein
MDSTSGIYGQITKHLNELSLNFRQKQTHNIHL